MTHMLSATQIRQAFLDFFAQRGHTIVPSAPIVIKNDPTLMFTNAGMNQFKDYFLGNKPPQHPRVADTQKCLRVSGKHNDLEEVGVDTYHHTMFEMLGNWSFGDPAQPQAGYFKSEAIAYSWELLTSVYGIPKDRLYVTVFEGDARENLPKDDEAAGEWKKWIAEERILLGNKKDNFWEMGDTGPCGPCTEIHVDCRSEEERHAVDGKTLVNADHPQVIEIWNNVFIQFNRKKDGTLEPLPAKHVDTGMGFERLVRVLQQKTSNYDTDVFSGTIAAIVKITGQEYDGSDSKLAVAFRVLSDHIRAISFTIADGQLPSNTGAGYVIRRILRRAVRYYYSYLNYKRPLLHQLVPVLADQFANVFPELKKQEAFVGKVVLEEEEAFLRTLEKGLKRIDELVHSTDLAIEGNKAFELYDTYGFPLDLTRLIAGEKGKDVDEEGFTAAMQQQKDRSRAATQLEAGDWAILHDAQNEFVGYDTLQSDTRILRHRIVKAKGQEQVQLVLEQTPFYAESGGQVGDRGTLTIGDETIEVLDTKKENDLIIHFANKLPADATARVMANVNETLRRETTVHHSVTHLLHAALKQVLGEHVAQKGSLNNENGLRFDFSHFAKLADDELQQVEQLVNEKIRTNIPVVIRVMAKEEAMQLGATALFGEKYGDMVRVVTMDPSFSIELCGGTHVGYTGELGLFKLTSEGAIAAGVRRIEALCGAAALKYIGETEKNLKGIAARLKNPKDLGVAIDKLQEENTTLRKRIEALEARALVGIRNELLRKDEIINQVSFVTDVVEVPHADALRKLCSDVVHHVNDAVVLLLANIDGKAFTALGVSDTVAAAKQLDASAIIKKTIAPLIKGGGGGQKNLATAGGQDVSRFAEVMQAVKSLL